MNVERRLYNRSSELYQLINAYGTAEVASMDTLQKSAACTLCASLLLLHWLLPCLTLHHMPCTYYAAPQVRPYNATEVQAALQYAMQRLPALDLQQLSNIAGALSAAGHLDPEFMQQLGSAAAVKIKAQPLEVDQAAGLRAFRTLCWLAVGFSRLGVLHPELMKQIALYGEAAAWAVCKYTLVSVPISHASRKRAWMVLVANLVTFGRPVCMLMQV